MSSPGVLVAGIGNIFLGDDGFGVEVVQRLAARPQPDGVRVTDFGIRGFDLAFALLDEPEATILIDAMPRGQAPGTVYVLEPDLDAETGASTVGPCRGIVPGARDDPQLGLRAGADARWPSAKRHRRRL